MLASFATIDLARLQPSAMTARPPTAWIRQFRQLTEAHGALAIVTARQALWTDRLIEHMVAKPDHAGRRRSPRVAASYRRALNQQKARQDFVRQHPGYSPAWFRRALAVELAAHLSDDLAHVTPAERRAVARKIALGT